MSELRIEPATLDDLSELTELLMDLFSQEDDFTPNREKQLRGLRLILEQPSRGRIFVLRNHKKIVGMINLLITISTAEGGFVLLLEDLVIRQEHRGQGYGSRLLKHAIEFARQKKIPAHHPVDGQAERIAEVLSEARVHRERDDSDAAPSRE